MTGSFYYLLIINFSNDILNNIISELFILDDKI